jgi:hypothetical protein
MIRFATDAIDALEGGNATSAQSLAGSLVDTLLRRYLPKTKPLILPGRKTKNADAYLDFSVRKYIVLAPIWQAYQSYYPTTAIGCRERSTAMPQHIRSARSTTRDETPSKA